MRPPSLSPHPGPRPAGEGGVPSPPPLSPREGGFLPGHPSPPGRGAGGEGLVRERTLLFLALPYQTNWFQQLSPTQVRFLVSLFRMTSVVDFTRIR